METKYKFLEKYLVVDNTQKLESFFTKKKTKVAIDNSGSTNGKILENTKKLITDVFKNFDFYEDIKNNIIAWNTDAKIEELSKIKAKGGTRPASLFDFIKDEDQNLFITTDGDIPESEVKKTKKKILGYPNLNNIIAFYIVSDRINEPCILDISVFFPFLNHVEKNFGNFYLFGLKNDKYYILSKSEDEIGKKNNKMPDPITDYNDDIKFEDLPEVKLQDILNLKFLASNNSGRILINSEKNLYLNLELFANEIVKSDILKTEEFENFLKKNILDLINKCKLSRYKKNYNYLRDIVKAWAKYKMDLIKNEKNPTENLEKISNLQSEIDKIKNDEKKLDNKAKEKKISELQSQINQLQNNPNFGKILTLNIFIESVMSSLNESQINEKEEKIHDYTLKNIKKLSNRLARAENVQISNDLSQWDTEENCIKCKECFICGEENQPCAILLIDALKNENDKFLLDFNASDEALNDLLLLGIRNKNIIPTGEFCQNCAKNLMNIKIHPITRQILSSYIILTDPYKKNNYELISNSVCSAIFNKKKIKGYSQILLGIFDAIEKKEILNENDEKRFSKEVYNWAQNLALFHCSANFLPENLGKTKYILEAMYDLVSYKDDKEKNSYLIPLKNKNTNSVSLICRCLFKHFKKVKNITIDENNLKKYCNEIMKKIFIKDVVESFINVCKKRAEKSNVLMFDYLYQLHNAIQSDLFNTKITGIPLENSEKIANFENSNFLKLLLGVKEYEEIIADIKIYDIVYSQIFKENKKIISDELVTILLLCFYAIIKKDSNAFRFFCDVNEKILVNFINNLEYNTIIKFTDDEKNLFKYLNEIIFEKEKTYDYKSNENLLKIIKLHSPYKNITEIKDKSHIDYISNFATHLYGPPVTQCCVCGEEFMTEDEKKQIKQIIENAQKRRNDHIKKFYNNDNELNKNDQNNLCSYHEIVRKICGSGDNKSLKKPNKEIIMEEINYALKKSKNRIGNIYNKDFINKLIILSNEFLQRIGKRKSFKEKLSILERIIIEINEDQSKYIKTEPDKKILEDLEIKKIFENMEILSLDKNEYNKIDFNIKERKRKIELIQSEGVEPRYRKPFNKNGKRKNQNPDIEDYKEYKKKYKEYIKEVNKKHKDYLKEKKRKEEELKNKKENDENPNNEVRGRRGNRGVKISEDDKKEFETKKYIPFSKDNEEKVENKKEVKIEEIARMGKLNINENDNKLKKRNKRRRKVNKAPRWKNILKEKKEKEKREEENGNEDASS